MRYHIDTIPVWDAYKEDCECPLCRVAQKQEQEYLDIFMGASVMEPSRRVEVNDRGFCARHLEMMLGNGNRLGLALMAHTHLKETMAKLDAISAKALAAANEDGKKSAPARLIGRAAGTNGSVNELKTQAEAAEKVASTCLFCEKLDDTMQRYVQTVIYMWKHEQEFRTALTGSKGFCLKHYAEVMKAAPEQLSGKELEEFVTALTTVQKTNLERLEKEIEWFTLKFDYRNQDKPWGTSKDAVERTVFKLRGHAALPYEKKKKD